MDNRFTLKDMVFVALIVMVAGAVCFNAWQYTYQESRLNDVRNEIRALNETQKQQLAVLNRLAQGGFVAANTGNSTRPGVEIVRKTNPDGSYTVSSARLPMSHFDPRDKPDYAQGDWLVNNLGDEPSTITPYLSRTVSESTPSGVILESLLTRDRETLEYQPWLAESYTMMADKITFRFVIRKEATFSDGKPVTADDVVFTFETVMNKDIEAEPMQSYLERLASVKKVDDRTVEMKFKEPYFEALSICSFNIMPKHVYQFSKPEEFNERKTTVVGSGPYVLERWDRGQKMVLARNEKYWGDKPAFDKLVYVFIMNPQASMQSFLAGEIDQNLPDPDQWEQYTAQEDFKNKFTFYKYVQPALSYRYIGWNAAKPQFKDKKTRQALTMMVDRQAIIKTIMRDMAVPTTGPFNPTSVQYDKTIQPWPFDPAKAKEFLAEAGWKAGNDGVLVRDGVKFEFEMTIPNKTPQYEKISAILKEEFQRAGIRMTIAPLEFAVMSQNLDLRKYDAAMLGWSGSAGEDDPTQIWSSKSIEGKGSNFVSFRNAETDALLEKAVRELDTDKRMEMWHRFHKIVHEEQPYTFLSSSVTRAFIAKRMQNTKPDVLGLDPNNWYVPAMMQKYR